MKRSVFGFNAPQPVQVGGTSSANDEEEKEDILDLLISEQKKSLRKKKLEETPRMMRPPISYAKHTEIQRTKEYELELLEIRKKVKEKQELLEKAKKGYLEISQHATFTSSGIEEAGWKRILSFLDAKTLLKVMPVNTLFRLLVQDDLLWKKLYHSIISEKEDQALNFDIPGETYFEKYKFLYNERNHDPVNLYVISTSGGSIDVSCDVDNLVNASYEPVTQFGTQTPSRKPYSTNFGKQNNIDIIMGLNHPYLIFKTCIILAEASKYQNPLKNAIVFISESEFTKEDVKKIGEVFNHVLKEDFEEVCKIAKGRGVRTPQFSFFEIADLAKESLEENRGANRRVMKPVLGNYILIKLIDHDGKGSNIDVGGFNAFGIPKK